MADVTISDLSPLTPSTGLVLPVSNGSSTGKVTLSQVCGVMTSAQITSALGYTPYNSTNPNGYITSSSLPSAQQLPRAWVNFNGANGTKRSDYNVASITRHGCGDYTVNFTSPMPNSNYCVLATCRRGYNGDNNTIINLSYKLANPLTTTSVRLMATLANGSYMGQCPPVGTDPDIVCVTIFG